MKASSTKHKKLKVALLFSLMAIFGFAVTGTFSTAESASKKSDSSSSTATSGSAATVSDPKDPSNSIYLDTSGKPAGLGDSTKPPSMAFKAGQGWHPQALGGAGLPKDRYGLIDWAKIVRGNLVNPRFSLDPNDEEMPPMDLDVLIPAKGDFVDDVIYPHQMHTWWLKCEICHPKIFVPARGQNDMSMVGIVQGNWCGRCHGKVAFPLTDCKRCHSSPKAKK